MSNIPPAFPREKVFELCTVAGIEVSEVTGIEIDAASITFKKAWGSQRFPLSVPQPVDSENP